MAYPVQKGAITSFSGEFFFLSNFYPCDVRLDDIVYPSSEHAYQAQKTLDQQERRAIAELPRPGQAKRAGQALLLRNDWEGVKRKIMLIVLRAKFQFHEELAEQLIETGNRQLVEGNHWGDRYWGCVKVKGVWRGQNFLGRTLMKVRDELRKPKPYRPSNGTEGEMFMGRFCERCVKDNPDEDQGCEILMMTMALDTDDEGYPSEWVQDHNGPRCTAFEQRQS